MSPSSRPQRRPWGVTSFPSPSRIRTGSIEIEVTRCRVGSRNVTLPSRPRRGKSRDASFQRQVFSPWRSMTVRNDSVLRPSTTIVSEPHSVSRVAPWTCRRHLAPPTSSEATESETPQCETV